MAPAIAVWSNVDTACAIGNFRMFYVVIFVEYLADEVEDFVAASFDEEVD